MTHQNLSPYTTITSSYKMSEIPDFLCYGSPVILFGHFYRLIWESFPIQQELSHDSIARLNCALPITKTISVIR